jgi:ribosomal protein S18 acetylase RimI-like enzyme
MSPDLAWRRMRQADLADVEPLGNAIHQDHPERPAVFAERLDLCPEGCFALESPDGLAGYVVSHPWTLGSPPALDTLLGAIPGTADTWYIHDLALHPRARGSGAGAEIVTLLAALATARGFASMSLIAVGQSQRFWAQQGFQAVALPIGKLDSYGSGVTYMTSSFII